MSRVKGRRSNPREEILSIVDVNRHRVAMARGRWRVPVDTHNLGDRPEE